MAGGKETPRQKMIGMMYLVLTALLAMNVSTTVLDKFAFINQSLETANNQTSERNQVTLESMKKSVQEKGSKPEDMAVISAAEEIRKKTAEVVSSLNESKEEFINITGGFEDPNAKDMMHIKGKTNYDKVGHYMAPKSQGGEGKGEAMKGILNGYVDNVKQVLLKSGVKQEQLGSFKVLAVDADEDPYFSKDPNQKGKPWASLQFDHSPTHAALATVSEFQANVLEYETQAIELLKGRVGLKEITFDEIRPVVMPQSQYVAAGTKYIAEMFIAASASSLNDKIKMTYNGKAIQVAEGKGKVEFTVTPGKYDKDGNAKKSFEAAISVPTKGGDTTFTSTIDYFVVKPVIQIQSQSVNALYYNCGNALDVQVPALGTQYNPSFSAKGGRAIKGSTKGAVTVVPKSRKVTLTVSSNGNVVGSRNFGVRAIPAPEVKVFGSNGKPVDLKKGISSRASAIYIKAIPDNSFKEFLPKDARFKVAQAEVTLVSGGIGRGTKRGGEKINLRGMNARKGDVLVIEIKSVQRKNFRGEVENFPKFNKYINIPLK